MLLWKRAFMWNLETLYYLTWSWIAGPQLRPLYIMDVSSASISQPPVLARLQVLLILWASWSLFNLYPCKCHLIATVELVGKIVTSNHFIATFWLSCLCEITVEAHFRVTERFFFIVSGRSTALKVLSTVPNCYRWYDSW